MGIARKSAAAAVAALALAAVTHPHRITTAVLDSAQTPSHAQRVWARLLLEADGLPGTSCNVSAIAAWETAEASTWSWHNPLDTTQPEPGSSPVNSVGVQAYPSWRKGFDATLTTLGNGRYQGILAALKAGDSAQAVADAVASSPWGTGHFNASC